MSNWFKKNKQISPHLITTYAFMGAAIGVISRDIIIVNGLYTPTIASTIYDFVEAVLLLVGLVLLAESAEWEEKFKEVE